jgi:hypothetical protein
MAFASMNYVRSKANPCLYFDWNVDGLVVWISWVDDCLVCGKQSGVLVAKKQMMDGFNCDEIGNMDEYVGCKVKRDYVDGSIKLTQPVMLQSVKDEFDLPGGPSPNTPAIPGSAMVRAEPENCVSQTK